MLLKYFFLLGSPGEMKKFSSNFRSSSSYLNVNKTQKTGVQFAKLCSILLVILILGCASAITPFFAKLGP